MTNIPSPSDSEVPPQLDPRQTGATFPVFGGYKLIERLGSGSYGEVWKAEAPGGVEAAIKVIFRPLQHSDAQRELDSLELMKRLRHPYLLQTQAFWSLEDRLLIAMELADGSLRDRLKSCVEAGHFGIPVEELLVYIGEASEALDYLHSKQVLHRDIKPDNILLLQRHAKIADFGVARLLQSTLARMTISGTPAFMPPESWSGQASDRSDQYSLAGSYVELRLNRNLFPSRDLAGTMMDHLERDPDLSPLPEPEQQALLRALAKDPANRYSSCLEFSRALRRAVGFTSGSLPALSGALIPAPTSHQNPAGAAAAESTPTARKFPASAPTSVSPASTATPSQWHTLPRGPRQTVRNRVAVWVLTALLLGLTIGIGAVLIKKSRDGPSGLADVYVPAGFQRDGEAKVVALEGRNVYERIAYVLADKTELVFLLIPPARSGDPPPFYVMRHKVTNHAFGQFAREHPDAVATSSWKSGAAGANEIPLGVNDYPFHPVVRVSVDEANGFARWLLGQLTTAQQWDKAAGRFDGAVGPYPGDGHGLRDQDLGVGMKALQPANRESAAASLFGCRDMAGNGYEWTCSVASDERERVPFDDPKWNERVSLRGTTYFAAMPFRFNDRTNSRYRIQNPQGEPGASAEVGFRVALPLSITP